MEICESCGARKRFEGHGRFIDGSWAHDKCIPEYNDKWICGFHCYEQLHSSTGHRC